MASRCLIAVHGMGNHTEESFKSEVVESVGAAAAQYPSLELANLEDVVSVRVVSYNDIFEDYKNAVSDRQELLDLIASIEGDFPALPSAGRAIAEIDDSVIEDSFFNTHWLDVILYRLTLMAIPIQLRVAKAVADAVAEFGSSKVHVLGHSLGTSVVHDALAKAYGPEPSETKLSTSSDRLGSVQMVANVSRVLQNRPRVVDSVVRPGKLGCCFELSEYRHILDPIPMVKPFEPANDRGWVTNRTFRKNYLPVRPNAVTAANVHALGHYVADPDVHVPLLTALAGRQPRKSEINDAWDAHDQNTIEGLARVLRDAVEDLDFSRESIGELLKAAKALKTLVESFKEEF